MLQKKKKTNLMRQSVFNASAPGNYGDSFDVVDVDTVAAVSFLFSFFLL